MSEHGVAPPSTLRVIVRDRLSANSIVLLQPEGNVLIDTGHVSQAVERLALLGRPEHLADRPLDLIVNTHCHSDHTGGNALLAGAYSCPIAVPEPKRWWNSWSAPAPARAAAF